jgi:hypothetical protein
LHYEEQLSSREETMAREALKRKAAANPFKLRKPGDVKSRVEDMVHVMGKGIRCDTEKRGHKTPRGRPPTKIVVDASEGFIPLWAKGTILRWQFRESSLAAFEDPDAMKAAVEELMAKAILAWGDAAPVKFAYREDAWDFEVIINKTPDCDASGCVLASAFFPDSGRHDLTIYPTMFEQTEKEKVETLIHEIGHIFGLRHFFAQVSEGAWPSEIFGKHRKFTIMNYGADSKLTNRDKIDLKKLYQAVWSGELKEINGTPIKLLKPFHESGSDPGELALAAAIKPSAKRPRRR